MNFLIYIIIFLGICSCSHENKMSILRIEEDHQIEFNTIKYNSIDAFSNELDIWMVSQMKLETKPILAFEPDPKSEMEFVNDVKDVVKKYHNDIRISVKTKEGKSKLVKFPPKVNRGDMPDISFLNHRNVLNLQIDNAGIYIDSINGRSVNLEQIKVLVLGYILSDGSNEELPALTHVTIPKVGKVRAATKLIITLKPSPTLAYKNYQELKWEILLAYEEARNLKSNEIFGLNYRNLRDVDRKTIHKIIPIV